MYAEQKLLPHSGKVDAIGSGAVIAVSGITMNDVVITLTAVYLLFQLVGYLRANSTRFRALTNKITDKLLGRHEN